MSKPWKVILAFVSVFLAGAIFGGLLLMRFSPRGGNPPKRASNNLPPPGGGAIPSLLRNLMARLDLTPEQKAKILPVVDRAEEDLRKVRQDSFHESGVILKRLYDELNSDLAPEQRKKLEKIQERQRELMREERERRAVSPGAPREKNGGKRDANMLKDAVPPRAPEPKAEPAKP
jgi:Spy/CpxP family protein refolding chaperone